MLALKREWRGYVAPAEIIPIDRQREKRRAVHALIEFDGEHKDLTRPLTPENNRGAWMFQVVPDLEQIVYRMARTRLRSNEDAEQVAGAAVNTLLRSQGPYGRYPGAVVNFAKKVVSHRLADFYRELYQRPDRWQLSDGMLSLVADHTARSPAELQHIQQMASLVEAEILHGDLLSDRERQIARLIGFRELKVREVADELGLSSAQVSQAIYSLRWKLKMKLAALEYIDAPDAPILPEAHSTTEFLVGGSARRAIDEIADAVRKDYLQH